MSHLHRPRPYSLGQWRVAFLRGTANLGPESRLDPVPRHRRHRHRPRTPDGSHSKPLPRTACVPSPSRGRRHQTRFASSFSSRTVHPDSSLQRTRLCSPLSLISFGRAWPNIQPHRSRSGPSATTTQRLSRFFSLSSAIPCPRNASRPTSAFFSQRPATVRSWLSFTTTLLASFRPSSRPSSIVHIRLAVLVFWWLTRPSRVRA